MAESGGRFSRLETKSGENKAPGLTPPEGTISREARRAKDEAELAGVPGEQLYPTFIEEADNAFFTGNYRDALRHYSRALQEENNRIYPWIGQISCLIMMKQYREAELWSNRALELFPEDPALLSQRARVLAYTGDLKRAIGVSDYAIGRGDSNWAWMARGEVLLEAGDNKAMFCFNKAMEQSEKSEWRIPLLIGLSYIRKRQWSTAEQFLQRASQANPNNHFIWYNLARVLHEMSYTDRALDCVRHSLQLSPEFKEARELEHQVLNPPLLNRIFGMLKR